MSKITNNINQSTKDPLPESWMNFLKEEFKKNYMKELKIFLKSEMKQYSIYPPMKYLFNAYHLTPFEQVKVIIIGQDPYHGHGQAHGLCFSVMPNIESPPSLLNIFQEQHRDMNINKLNHGCLIEWGKQGVFLINSILTVRKSQSGSHREKGWEKFTNKTIEILNQNRKNLVFILLGAFAQKKKEIIDHNKHCILETTHPSPFSAHKGFLGSGIFSKTNKYLVKNGYKAINWQLSSKEQILKFFF